MVLDNRPYYVGSQYARRTVVAQLDAASRQVRFFNEQRVLLTVNPLQGLVGKPMSLEALVTWCEQEARALWRRPFALDRSVLPSLRPVSRECLMNPSSAAAAVRGNQLRHGKPGDDG